MTPSRVVSLSEPLTVSLVIEATFAGVALHVRELASGLARRDHQVLLLWSRRRADRPFLDFVADPPPGVTPHELPMDRSVGPADWSAVVRARQLLGPPGRVHLVHGHSSKGGAVARLAALSLRIPSVATPNAIITNDPTLGPVSRAMYGAMEVTLGLAGQAIIAVSEEEVEALRRLRLPRRRIHLIPNAIEPLDPSDRPFARGELNAQPGERVVGFVGRLAPQKDPEMLVRAFAAMGARDVRLVMLGDGPMRPAVDRLVEELNLQGRVTMLGEVPARRLIPGFDVMALSSRYEGHPHVVMEALSAGVPVVSTRTGGIPGMLGDGAGLMVPVGDQAALTAALDRMLGDAGLASSAAAQGLKQAAAFDIDTMIGSTEELYRSLIDRSSGRRRARRSA
jgi:glycosyltransferase involved in cell wall biosynthesis